MWKWHCWCRLRSVQLLEPHQALSSVILLPCSNNCPPRKSFYSSISTGAYKSLVTLRRSECDCGIIILQEDGDYSLTSVQQVAAVSLQESLVYSQIYCRNPVTSATETSNKLETTIRPQSRLSPQLKKLDHAPVLER